MPYFLLTGFKCMSVSFTYFGFVSFLSVSEGSTNRIDPTFLDSQLQRKHITEIKLNMNCQTLSRKHTGHKFVDLNT